MGVYKYVREAWKKPSESIKDFMRARLIAWRREPSTVRVMRPSRIDKARSLGYKAKQGFTIVRQRVARGGRMHANITAGRRPKHNTQTKIVAKNYQRVAEEKVQRAFTNMEVINSYEVACDGTHLWYEVILVDDESNDDSVALITNMLKKKT